MVFDPWKITRRMFLSEGEVEALLMHLARRCRTGEPDERVSAFVDRVIVESLLFSGLRNSEFCRLTLANVDLGPEPALHVRGTPREDRTVFIPGRLADLLREYLTDVRPQGLPEGTDRRERSQPLVFNERSRSYERTALYRRVVRTLTEAGLKERAKVQLLRHTYGYLAYLRTGGNLLFVQRQLGHAHPMVTVIYAEFVEESYAEMANAIGGGADRPKRASGRRKTSSRSSRS